MLYASRALINQVREFMERHLDVFEIARRMSLDVDDVRAIIDIINNIIT